VGIIERMARSTTLRKLYRIRRRYGMTRLTPEVLMGALEWKIGG
jgi:hypothetical protein